MKKTEVESKITMEEIEQFILEAGSDHLPTFGGSFEGGIQAQQVPDELAPCILAILQSGESIKSFLEIGAAAGGTTFLMNHFLHPERIVLIDDNRHPKAHVRSYVLRDVPHEEIIGQSQAQGSVDALTALNVTFDMILIDGDHSYAGVKKDAEIYREFLGPGGFLIFHDSALQTWGVSAVVAELKADGGFEFIAEYVSKKWNVCGLAMFRKAGE